MIIKPMPCNEEENFDKLTLAVQELAGSLTWRSLLNVIGWASKCFVNRWIVSAPVAQPVDGGYLFPRVFGRSATMIEGFSFRFIIKNHETVMEHVVVMLELNTKP